MLMPCFSLGFCDNIRSMPRGWNVSLLFFITFVNGSKSLVSFLYCFFHFRRLPGLRLASDSVKENGRFWRIQCQRDEKRSSCGKKTREIFLCQGTVWINFWEVIRAEGLKHLPESGEENSRDIRREAIAREAMWKSSNVRMIEWKKVRTDGSIKYFISINIWTISRFPKWQMIFEFQQNENISDGKENRRRKEIGCEICKEEQIGGT